MMVDLILLKRYLKLLKEYLGVLILDFPRYFYALRSNNLSWIHLCNRIDQLQKHSSDIGVMCAWQWSRTLHAPQLFPFLGKLLMAKSLKSFPIEFAEWPDEQLLDEPEISFIIGHRGLERLPHLLLTLKTIAAQQHVAYECIVVEQSVNPEIQVKLPKWVQYIHDPYNHDGYNRSRTFNIGVAHAKGKLLVLQDNDMAVPSCYGKLLLTKFKQGYEVVNLKRFIFYLNQISTENLFEKPIDLKKCQIESIVQNLEAGGSLAIGKEAYKVLGGFDEDFVGWGGEDLDFWERCTTRNIWNYTCLPIIHFWHSSQPEKTKSKDSFAMQRYYQLTQIDLTQRIQSLKSKSVFKL